MTRCRQFVKSQVSEDLFMPCAEEAPHEIRGFPLCTKHYVEALEHGAHLDFGQWDGNAHEKFYIEPEKPAKKTETEPSAI